MKKFISAFMTILMVCSCFSFVLAMPTTGENKITGEAATFVDSILGTIQFVGYAIAIGMLIYVGIKYVMASANEKADLKNAMIKYVIGAILIAGAATIAPWFFNIAPGKTAE